MGQHKIDIKRSALKSLKSLPQASRKRIVEKIDALADNPRPPGVVKLEGREGWRIRVGTYRVIYRIEDDVLHIEVIYIGPRKEAYR